MVRISTRTPTVSKPVIKAAYLDVSNLIPFNLSKLCCLITFYLSIVSITRSIIVVNYKLISGLPFTDEAQTALFKDPVRTAL